MEYFDVNAWYLFRLNTKLCKFVIVVVAVVVVVVVVAAAAAVLLLFWAIYITTTISDIESWDSYQLSDYCANKQLLRK